MTTMILCLSCHQKVPRSETYVDRIGQFTKLNMKAIDMGRKDVEICYDCFEKLTDKSDSESSGAFGYS